MARRTEELVIADSNPEYRDNGKVFILTEMDAFSGQRWAARAIFAIAKGGTVLPDDAVGGGWAGLAGFGLAALFRSDYELIEPLLNEMLQHAKYQHVPGHPLQSITPGKNCCVEEIKTFLTIQMALFKLHTGFSLPAVSPK